MNRGARSLRGLAPALLLFALAALVVAGLAVAVSVPDADRAACPTCGLTRATRFALHGDFAGGDADASAVVRGRAGVRDRRRGGDGLVLEGRGVGARGGAPVDGARDGGAGGRARRGVGGAGSAGRSGGRWGAGDSPRVTGAHKQVIPPISATTGLTQMWSPANRQHDVLVPSVAQSAICEQGWSLSRGRAREPEGSSNRRRSRKRGWGTSSRETRRRRGCLTPRRWRSTRSPRRWIPHSRWPPCTPPRREEERRFPPRKHPGRTSLGYPTGRPGPQELDTPLFEHCFVPGLHGTHAPFRQAGVLLTGEQGAPTLWNTPEPVQIVG